MGPLFDGSHSFCLQNIKISFEYVDFYAKIYWFLHHPGQIKNSTTKVTISFVFDSFLPDFVFYLAGADPYSSDRLGLLDLSKEGLATRDQMVMDFCCEKGIPIAFAMAGGYAPEISDIVDIHFQTVKIALESRTRRK